MANDSLYSGTPGIPAGGTAGQVIEKVDGVDYNVQWVTPAMSSIDFKYSDGSGFLEAATNNNYTTVSAFIYSGTAASAPITAVKVLGYCKNSGKTSDFRIWDATNNQTVAESIQVFGFNGGVFAIWDMGAISNLPTSEAILEIQGKKSASNGERFFLYSVKVVIG